MRNDAASIAAYSGVKISQEGRWTAPGFAAPAGIMPLHVRIEVHLSPDLHPAAELSIMIGIRQGERH